MNKAIKKIVFGFFILVSFFFSTKKVWANSINKIEMDVYIDYDGDATIVEVWKANLTEGTEGYRPYTNLGSSSISNFSVSDDSGKRYEFLTNWKTSANFHNKAYKNGFNYISGGVELCWGISNYGNRTYTLKYNISDFVTQYKDTQGIYFNFLDLDQSVGEVKITIHSDFDFSLDNARIWAFGNDGSINFSNGKIILRSDGYLSKSQYMTGLIRFESNLFKSPKKSNKSFDDIYDSAMESLESESSSKEKKFPMELIPLFIIVGIIFLFLLVVIIKNFVDLMKIGLVVLGFIIGIILFWFTIIKMPILFPIYIFVFVIIGIVSTVKSGTDNNKIILANRTMNSLDFGETGKVLPKDSDINYWREIPCNKDLVHAYWVAYNYDIVPTNFLREGILGAFLLKWIKDGIITVSETKKGLFSIKDNNYAIDFSNTRHVSDEVENKLLEMFKSAAGINNILEAKEFEKWCQRNCSKIQNWFFDLIISAQTKLENQKLIIERQEDAKGFLGMNTIKTVKQVTPKLKEDALQLKGLRKFLLDFSMMHEKEYFEVHLWEYYLIYAQLLGIADKVEEQFSKLYPEFKEQTKLNTDITTIAIRNMVNIGYKSYQNAIYIKRTSSSRDYSGSSRDSGGGGRSYSSGGRSSGGSSGGGFR